MKRRRYGNVRATQVGFGIRAMTIETCLKALGGHCHVAVCSQAAGDCETVPQATRCGDGWQPPLRCGPISSFSLQHALHRELQSISVLVHVDATCKLNHLTELTL